MEIPHRDLQIVEELYLLLGDRKVEFSDRRKARQEFIRNAAQLIDNHGVQKEKDRDGRKIVSMTPEVEVPTRAGLVRIVLEKRIDDYWTEGTETKFSLFASFPTTDLGKKQLLFGTESLTGAFSGVGEGSTKNRWGRSASLQEINEAIKLIGYIKKSLDSGVPPRTP